MRLEHNEIAAASKTGPRKNRVRGTKREADPITFLGRPKTLRKNQANALSGTRRGMGSGITGQIRRDNVGKIHSGSRGW